MEGNRLIGGAFRLLCNTTRIRHANAGNAIFCLYSSPSLGSSPALCHPHQQRAPFATRMGGSGGPGGPSPATHLPPQQERERRNRLGRLMMSKELRERKLRLIEAQKEEQVPKKFFAKFHYYFKRYWYIAIPVHIVVCGVWFAGLYFAVKFGINVVAVLEWLRLPDSWVQKVREIPPSAGFAVAALILYKIATPLRYACTLLGTRLAFNALRRKGRLRTTRELDLAVRQRTDRLIERLDQRRQRQRKRPTNGNGKKHSLFPSSTTSKSKDSGTNGDRKKEA